MRITFELVGEETFTFTPEGGEAPIHIRSGALREWLLAHAMHKVIDLTFPNQPLEEIVELHGLEEARMQSMGLLEAGEPVVVGICDGGTNILIDGAHRRWFWAKRGVNTIRGWAVPKLVWETFTYNPADFPFARQLPDGALLPQRRGHK